MMFLSEAEEYLEHFGKKGMKWGVRKKTSKSSKPESAKSIATKQHLKKAGKTTLKVAIRASLVAALAAIGIPVAAAGATLAAIETASPEVIAAGKLHANGMLPEIGLKRFSALNQFRIGAVSGLETAERAERR